MKHPTFGVSAIKTKGLVNNKCSLKCQISFEPSKGVLEAANMSILYKFRLVNYKAGLVSPPLFEANYRFTLNMQDLASQFYKNTLVNKEAS